MVVSREGRRRELKSTELTDYVSGTLFMLSHLAYVKKGIWDLVHGTSPLVIILLSGDCCAH